MSIAICVNLFSKITYTIIFTVKNVYVNLVTIILFSFSLYFGFTFTF